MNDFAFANSALPPLVRAALCALAFCLVGVGLGRRVSKWLRLDLSGVSAAEQGLLAVSLGGGLLEFVPYVLAQLGVMTPPVLRFTFLGLGALLLPDIVASLRAAWTAWSKRAIERVPPAAWAFAALGVSLLFVFGVYAATVCDLSEDDGYHLAAPVRWLQRGSLTYLPTYTNTNTSMGFEMLYAIGLSLWDAVAAKAFNYSAGLFALSGVVLCAARLGSVAAGATAVALLLITTPLINLQYVFGLAYVDLGACWMAMASLLAWLLWYEYRRFSLLLLTAWFAGMAGSFKTTAVALAIAWAPVALYELIKSGTPRAVALFRVVQFGLLSSVPVLPWFFRNFQQTGNPLFPMLSSLIPTRDWPPEHAALFSKFVRYYSWGVARGFGLGESQRKLIVLGAAAAVLAGTALAVWLVRRPVLRSVLVFSGGFLAISILLTGVVQRYWLPAFMSLAIVAVSVAYERFPALIRGWVPATGLMALALLSAFREPPSGHFFWRDLRIASGYRTMEEEYRDSTMYQIWRYLNRQTPADSRVLLASFYSTFGSSSYGAFGVDRTCFVTDAHMQAYLHLDTWDAFVDSLREASIDYAVVADRQFTGPRVALTSAAIRNEFPFSRRLADELGEKVFALNEVAVYRLRLPPAQR